MGEFPGDAQGSLHCEQTVWWLAPVEDMQRHTIQDGSQDRESDSHYAGYQVLQRLRTSWSLLCHT